MYIVKKYKRNVINNHLTRRYDDWSYDCLSDAVEHYRKYVNNYLNSDVYSIGEGSKRYVEVSLYCDDNGPEEKIAGFSCYN